MFIVALPMTIVSEELSECLMADSCKSVLGLCTHSNRTITAGTGIFTLSESRKGRCGLDW